MPKVWRYAPNAIDISPNEIGVNQTFEIKSNIGNIDKVKINIIEDKKVVLFIEENAPKNISTKGLNEGQYTVKIETTDCTFEKKLKITNKKQ